MPLERIIYSRSEKLPVATELWLELIAEKMQHLVHFDHAECLALLKMYQRLDDIEKVDRMRFRCILYSGLQITDSFMLDRIYRMADKDDNGFISHEEWLSLLSVMLRGTLDELIEFCYNIYDINGDRAVSRDELYMLLGPTFKARGDLPSDDVADYVKDLVEITMNKLDVDKDGIITFTDYKAAVDKDRLLLQCCGTCLPPNKAIKGFQCTFTFDYMNFFREWREPTKDVKVKLKQSAIEANRKRLAHRRISDVYLPAPSLSAILKYGPEEIFVPVDPKQKHRQILSHVKLVLPTS